VDDEKEPKVAPSCKPKTITTTPAKKVDEKKKPKVPSTPKMESLFQ
jgi:hypothetical protein